MSAIRTEQLTKTYGKARGVLNINLDVEEGEIFGFIGPNGAGKSTTIRMLMQLLAPTSGQITLLNWQVKGDMPDLRRQIGYLPSEIHLYKELTGRQVLDFTARAYGLSLKDTPAEEYAELLQYDMGKKVNSYSLGNRKKLGIIQSLLHQPKLLILDEPTSGLDPLIQHAFFELLKELNQKGMTIFFSTHVLNEVEKICGRVAIIREGELVGVSKVDEIAGRNSRVVKVRFEQSGNLIEPLGLRAIDPEVLYVEDSHIFTVHGPIHLALRALSEYPIADITIEKPKLEELFMKYYEKAEGGVVR